MSCNPCYLEKTPTKTTLHCGDESLVVKPVPPGPAGEKGEPGKAGDSCSVKTTSTEPSGVRKLVIQCGAKEHTITIPKGEKGEPGEKGTQGEKGAPGQNGNSCFIFKIEKTQFNDQKVVLQCGDKKVEFLIPGTKYNRQFTEFSGIASSPKGGGIVRHMSFTKLNLRSKLRALYFDQFHARLLPNKQGTCACSWSIFFDGRPCIGLLDLEANSQTGTKVTTAFMGYCARTSVRAYTSYRGVVEVGVVMIPGKNCECITGKVAFNPFLEVEEVEQ